MFTLLNFRAVNEPPTASGYEKLARFSVIIDDSITLYDFLLAHRGGRHFVFPPFRGADVPTASLAPWLRRELINLALDELKDAHDSRHAA